MSNANWTQEMVDAHNARVSKGGKLRPINLEKAVANTAKIMKPMSPEDLLNKTEKQFLSMLRDQFKTTTHKIGIQDITFRLAARCTYTPDFSVQSFTTGAVIFYEVKGGFQREDGWIKLKMAAATFTVFKFYRAQLKKKIWKYTLINQ